MSNTSWTPQIPPSDRKVARDRDITKTKTDSAVETARFLPQPYSRLITVSNYKQILTSLQVLADAVTIALSFLAGYYLWSLVGPIVAIDIYEPESLYRYYSFLGVTLITTLVGL